MKYILSISIFVLFISCTKDDNDSGGEITSETLSGTWNCTNLNDFHSINTYTSPCPEGGELSQDIEFHYNSIKWAFSDSTVTYKADVSINYSYTSDDPACTGETRSESQNLEDMAGYGLQGKELSIQSVEGLQVYSIAYSANNTLQLTFLPEKSDTVYGSTAIVYKLTKE